MKRRQLIRTIGAGGLAAAAGPAAPGAERDRFRLRYILSSAMYGEMPLADILPEVEKTGSEAIDIWCKVHANHREQIDAMGHAAARSLFEKSAVKPAVFTRYPLGPFKLGEEMEVARAFGVEILLCGTTKPSGPSGEEAKRAVRGFLEKMKPHVERAAEHGLTIAVENHSSQLLYHPDSLRYFAEFNKSEHLGVAFAPHHLHLFVDQIPGLIRELGDANIPFIYFQEHSEGMRKKMPKEIEMRQMPGFGGGLDYRPIVKALKEIGYRGYCEIFMHPVPRGIPILPTIEEITAAINKSRAYVEECLSEA